MNEETIQLIMQIITNYGPSVVAIVTMIISVITAVKKCKAVSSSSVEELRKMNKNLCEELAESKKENRDMKKLMAKVVAKQNHIHVVEKED